MPGLKHRFSYEDAAARLQKLETHEIRVPIAGKLNVALVFPGSYAVGMSNLGFLTIHRLTGTVQGVGVERFFPALDRGMPLQPPFYSFETRRPLGDFDLLAFSISFEGDFDAIPLILKPLGIPILAEQRKKGRFPLLVAGGAAIASNPEALSRMFDLLVPGEGERVWPELLRRLLSTSPWPDSVEGLSGVWVPAFCPKPAPSAQRHNVAAEPAFSHITTPSNLFGGAHLLEVMRGCPRSCPFCLARVIYHPPRPLPLDAFCRWLDARPAIADLGLIAPSLFDHPDIEGILRFCGEKGLRLRNSSVKWERLSDTVLRLLNACGVRGLTVAPESGSESLRRKMGKPLREDSFFDTMGRVSAHGFTQLKLYFMAGFPSETDSDLEATVEFLFRAVECARPVGLNLGATFAGFVPKQGTALSESAFLGSQDLKRRFALLRRGLRPLFSSLKVRFESPEQVARQVWLARVGPELSEEYMKEDSRCQATKSPSLGEDFDREV